MSLQDVQGRDTPKNSQPSITPLSMKLTSEVDVMTGDNTVLDVPPKHFLLQEIMPVVEQDIHEKLSKTKVLEGTIGKADLGDWKSNSVIRMMAPLTTLTMASNQPPLSTPGAYCEGGDSIIRSDENDCVDNVPISDVEASGNYQQGLAVAHVVEGQNLEFAVPEADKPLPHRENATTQYKTFIFLSFIFLLAMGAVFMAVLLLSPTDSPHQESQDEAEKLTPEIFSPSQAPTSLKEYVLSLLPEETTMVILDDSNSSQSRAYHWLLDDDLLHHMPEEQIKQRFALATLYFATSGDEWSNNTNWLNYSVHECDWYTTGEFGMRTELSALFPGWVSGFYSTEQKTICDQDGLYHHLWLDQNNLVGSLPEELYMLTQLQTISMIFNGLQGTISTRIGLLSSLEGWALMHMKNGGTIPTQIGLLTDLRLISIEGNEHLGPIPKEFWQLTQLEYIDLGRNPQLKGTLPTEIGTFQNLSWISMDDTGLTGTIPTEIAIQSLDFLSIGWNTLLGTVPSELGLLTATFYVSVVHNDLTGTIPTELAHMTSLSQLSLGDNHLEGPIPSQLGLLTNLKWFLTFRENELTGTIPSELGLLSGLYELEFRDNQLTGMIPSELGQLTSMGFISFANNSLSGSVPQELYSLHASLHTLSLEDNPMLSGILPNEICEINRTCVGNGLTHVTLLMDSGLVAPACCVDVVATCAYHESSIMDS